MSSTTLIPEMVRGAVGPLRQHLREDSPRTKERQQELKHAALHMAPLLVGLLRMRSPNNPVESLKAAAEALWEVIEVVTEVRDVIGEDQRPSLDETLRTAWIERQRILQEITQRRGDFPGTPEVLSRLDTGEPTAPYLTADEARRTWDEAD